MEMEEGITASTDNTHRDLHNSSYDTKAEFNNCFIIHSTTTTTIPSLKTWLKRQVAQARNMSIGEHRHCCVTFKI